MPADKKYLVTLSGSPHKVMSGGELENQEEPEHRSAPTGSDQNSAGGHRGGQRKGGGGSPGSDSHADGESHESMNEAQPSPTLFAINVVAIHGVTTAFLDAYLKNNAVAHEWLEKDGRRWLGDKAELLVK